MYGSLVFPSRLAQRILKCCTFATNRDVSYCAIDRRGSTGAPGVQRWVERRAAWEVEIVETQLGRMLAQEHRPDPMTAFRIARRWFQAGRRIEMQELAAELGVNRATLFRWVGGR